MGSKSAVLVVLGACLAALAWFLTQSGTGQANETGVSQQAIDRSVEVEQKADLADTGVEATTRPARSEARVATVADEEILADGEHPWAGMLAGLKGRVVEEDGTPIVGMPVELLEFELASLLDVEFGAMGHEDIDVANAVTDGEGRFLLEGAQADAFHVVALDRAGGRSSVRIVEQSLEHEAIVDMGDIVLPTYGTVIGTVLDEDGEPVAGARVRLAAIPEPVVQSGILDVRQETLIAGGEGGQFEVFDLPAQVMTLIDRLPVPTTTTLGDGTFRLEGVPVDLVVGGVDMDGFVATIIQPFEVEAGENDLGELDLEIGRTVTGQVVDRLGKPVEGAEVRAGAMHPLFPVGFMQPAGLSDEQGNFQMVGCPELGTVIAAGRRGDADAWEMVQAAGGSSNVRIVLDTTTDLLVTLRDEAGEPVEGASLTLKNAGEEKGMMGFATVALNMPRMKVGKVDVVATEEPGQYLVRDLTLGRWMVEARAPGFAMSREIVEHRYEPSAAEIVMSRGRTLTVNVTDAGTKEPVGKAHARIIGPLGFMFGAMDAAWTDPMGVATLGPVPSGEALAEMRKESFFQELIVEVDHPQYGTGIAKVKEGEDILNIELPPACTLTGRVTWAGESPQNVYMLFLVRDSGPDGMDDEIGTMFTLPKSAVSNLTGEFRFTGLPPADYKLEVMTRFLDGDPIQMIVKQEEPETVFRTEVEVEVGGENFVDVTLEADGEGPKGIFAGRVMVEGAPVAGAKVTISGRGDNFEYVTDGFGEFESDPLSSLRGYSIDINAEILQPDGTYEETEVYSDWERPNSGGVTRIDVELDYEVITVLVVNAANGEPLPEVEVMVEGGESGETNSEGLAEVMLPDHKAHLVSAVSEGFMQGTQMVTWDPNTAAPHVRLELNPSAPCRGRVVLPDGVTVGEDDWIWVAVAKADEGRRNEDWSQVEKSDLTFNVQGLAAGDYTARLWTSGSRGNNVVDFSLPPEGDTNLVFDFASSN